MTVWVGWAPLGDSSAPCGLCWGSGWTVAPWLSWLWTSSTHSITHMSEKQRAWGLRAGWVSLLATRGSWSESESSQVSWGLGSGQHRSLCSRCTGVSHRPAVIQGRGDGCHVPTGAAAHADGDGVVCAHCWTQLGTQELTYRIQDPWKSVCVCLCLCVSVCLCLCQRKLIGILVY